MRINITNSSEFTEIGSHRQRKVVWYYNKNINNFIHYPLFLNSIKSSLFLKLNECVNKNPIKFNLKLESTYNKPNVDASSENRSFTTSAIAVFAATNIENVIEGEFRKLLSEETEYMGRGSGFSLQKIDGLMLGVHRYTPLGCL